MAIVARILSNWTVALISFQDDCERSAEFANAYFAGIKRPYGEIIQLVRSVAPDPFRNVSTGQIVDWADNWNGSFRSVARQARDECLGEFCFQMPWEGNTDLAGIGVFVAYAIEAALATVFLAILGYQRLFRSKRSPKPVSHNFLAAFETSFGLFWDSALLFNVAVAFSALLTIGFGDSNYEVSYGLVGSSFTWVIPWVAWPLYLPMCRHKRARWIALCIMPAVQCYLSWVFLSKKKEDSIFERYCTAELSPIQETLYLGFLGTVSIGVGVVAGLLPLAYLGLCFNVLRKGKKYRVWWREWPETTGVARRCPWPFKALWYIALTGVMYSGLFVMAISRDLYSRMAGPSFSENKWSFGQAMAIATWGPTFIDFLIVYKGHLNALNYRLPVGVEVRVSAEGADASTAKPTANTSVDSLA